MAHIDKWLTTMVQKKGSDLHLAAGRPPLLRLNGALVAMENEVLLPQRLDQMFAELTGATQIEEWRKGGDLDFAYAIAGLARFRVNLFKQENGPGAVLRVIPEKILSLEDLGAPAALGKLADLPGGLALVTGPTGSGKSTTMAAIINAINERHARHIITIEDPLEFVHPRKKSLFSQREVGAHARSFAEALKAAVREDPDVLLVGEMRDRETIGLALQAAEMGILVFGTLHTNSAAKTIARVVDAFPEDEQPGARASLAESLVAVVAQLLLPKKDGKGRVAVHEILLRSSALANLIREGNTSMLSNAIQAGKSIGMQTMDDALLAAIKDDKVAVEEVMDIASDKKKFEALLRKEEQ
ncbi:MAG: type IV pilus twitching motility protein PilT [Deltaproteobacteria bacterium]|nr:type IV pilus twitching motility protein PilT [Deltaproteobacteria bacterium]